ncbi:hypothetical protein [Larkinella rosea]|uniref:hypothetical protein n=1 Tax=Larkinella rosea TaxID=2025312 RepID=UPI00286E88B0|nr:hypothetical protein [Larkinella rosea]
MFDYIRRAIPFNASGSLSNAEVYSLTAYLLQANKIINSTWRVKSDGQVLFRPEV